MLVIDAGNTNIVFALYDGDELCAIHRMETAAVHAVDDVHLPFDLSGVTAAVVGSVVPRLDPVVKQFAGSCTDSELLFVTHETVPMVIKLDVPAQAGADRLINAYAAACDYGAPVVVVDFGTATTFDVVDADGAFVGGVIAPGVNLSKEALVSAAAKLPDICVESPAHVIGTNTVDAMQSGLYWGYASMIEGMLARIEGELGVKPAVVATGGLAPLFADAIPAIEKVDKDLTLRGLARIYQSHGTE